MQLCQPPMLTVVLDRIRESPGLVLLLAPAWPKQPWCSSLMVLSIRLPLNQYHLLQGNWTHPSSEMISLHAWTLLEGTESRDPLHGLLISLLRWYGFQHQWSTERLICTYCTCTTLSVQRFYDSRVITWYFVSTHAEAVF